MPAHECLYCYEPIEPGQTGFGQDYHATCSRKFFGKPNPPILTFDKTDLVHLAKGIVHSQKTITGVQPKLSLSGGRKSGSAPISRLTIVGFRGEYILKPQTDHYPQLPENEDLTMHLAAASGIQTVDHTLIRLKSGELAYLTKRIDRTKSGKLHMEDMCQLTERLTEQKYKGSHEQIAKTIRRYSVNPGLDVINFYELVLFSFLTGNNDMHLKNFSLLKTAQGFYQLAPAYDLVASELVVEGDDEELALTLNGKKKNLHKKDFIQAMQFGGINEKAVENIFAKFEPLLSVWYDFIDNSFMDNAFKSNYRSLIAKKFEQLNLI